MTTARTVAEPDGLPALGAGEVPASTIETHTALLFAAGDLVLKIKKPVRFPFLDFSTREMRERACHREVELNRRLAPDVYLGVSDLLDPDGSAWEHAVVMRRMPPDRSLSHLAAAGRPVAEVTAVAQQVAEFHRSAIRSPGIDAACTRDAVRRLWTDNLVEIRAGTDIADRDVVERIEHLAMRFLAGRAALFDERIASGMCCDGHGDLQAADIFCLDDGPRILDCIEFDDQYRYGDVAADVAFLVMDLERLGSPELGAAVVAAYEDASGQRLPAQLLHHYIAYRALVRAKVTALRSRQASDAPSRAVDLRSASELLYLCARHLEDAQVRVVVIGGLPGTGKTTLATGLARQLGATLLRSDVVRKELAGLPPDEPARADLDSGLYDRAHSDRTYAALVDRARCLIERGQSVVLDASWNDDAHRAPVRAAARSTSSELSELCCELPADLAAGRMRRRDEEGMDASDATPAIAAALARRADPWPEARKIVTDAEPDQIVERALGVVRGRA